MPLLLFLLHRLILVQWLCAGVSLLTSAGAWAQDWPYPPGEPDSFKKVWMQSLAASRLRGTTILINQFSRAWDLPEIELSEKKALIRRLQWLHRRKLSISDASELVVTFLLQQDSDSYIRLDTDAFLNVVDTIFAQDRIDKGRNFLKYLQFLLPKGIIYENQFQRWQVSEEQYPKITFRRQFDSLGQVVKSYPALVFNQVTLTFTAGKDSSKIQASLTNVKGHLNLYDEIFVLDSGRYSWERLGENYKQIYCDLGKTEIELQRRAFKTKHAVLHYPELIKESAVPGKFEELFGFKEKPEMEAYPHFESYQGDIPVESFVEAAQYLGGVRMRGIHAFSIRIGEVPAKMWLFRPAAGSSSGDSSTKSTNTNQPVFRFEAEEIPIDKHRVDANKTAVTLWLPSGDSITHGGMNLIYDVKKRQIRLLENAKDRISWQAMRSSFHKMYLGFEALVWPMDGEVINLTSIVDAPDKDPYIQSFDYFRREVYDRKALLTEFNPLGALYEIYLGKEPKTGTGADSVFTLDEVLFYLDTLQKGRWKYQKDKLTHMLAQMEAVGYVSINRFRETVSLTPHGWQQVRAAYRKQDYDHVIFALTEPPNNEATLDYATGELTAAGIARIPLSDSQSVSITPMGTVRLGANRRMRFAGVVNSGRASLFHSSDSGFVFDYEDFKIDFINIDSLRFYPGRNMNYTLNERNAYLFSALERLKVEKVSGTLYIDNPNRKSGFYRKKEKKDSQYAKIVCNGNSFKYWRDSSAQRYEIIDSVWRKYVYDTSQVRFRLDPFEMDSLESFALSDIQFTGTFESGIFPAFADTLKPVDDRTFGVTELTPEEGFPAYDSIARFKNLIVMDEMGLHGNGELSWGAIAAAGDTFLFTPDSVMARTRKFSVMRGELLFPRQKKAGRFPAITADTVSYKWFTKKDTLIVRSLRKPIHIYDDETEFRGVLTFTPQGVSGRGTVKVGGVTISTSDTDQIIFDTDGMRFDGADFLANDAKGKTHFIAKRVRGDFAFGSQKGRCYFESKNPDTSNFWFPNHFFRSYTLNVGRFDRNSGDLELVYSDSIRTGTDSARYGPYVFLDRAGQPDLWIPAKSVYYNLNERIMKLSGADSVAIADALIFPEAGKLQIREGGLLDSLSNAQIKITNDGRVHHMTEASVKIFSGLNYTASANYQYKIPGKDGNPQVIRFSKIYVSPENITSFAETVLGAERDFYISPRMKYQGKVSLDGRQEFLNFNGKIKLEAKTPAVARLPMIEFNEKNVNPDTVVVPLDRSAVYGKVLGLQFQLRKGRVNSFYQGFLEKRPNFGSLVGYSMLLPEGIDEGLGLTFEAKTGEFKVGYKGKLLNKQHRGQVVAIQDDSARYTTQGMLNLRSFFQGVGKENKPLHIQMDVAGTFTGFNDAGGSKHAGADLLIGLSFPGMDEKWFDLIGKDFKSGAISEVYCPSVNLDDSTADGQRRIELLSELLDKENNYLDVYAVAKNPQDKAELENLRKQAEPVTSVLLAALQDKKSKSKEVNIYNFFPKNKKPQLLLRVPVKYYQNGRKMALVCNAFDNPEIELLLMGKQPIGRRIRGFFDLRVGEAFGGDGSDRKETEMRLILDVDTAAGYWMSFEFTDPNQLAINYSTMTSIALVELNKFLRKTTSKKKNKDANNIKKLYLVPPDPDARLRMHEEIQKYYQEN
jgi:hypothetical protein